MESGISAIANEEQSNPDSGISEWQKADILVSRIQDIFGRKFGHFLSDIKRLRNVNLRHSSTPNEYK